MLPPPDILPLSMTVLFSKFGPQQFSADFLKLNKNTFKIFSQIHFPSLTILKAR
jgi:hypothetical protein